MLVYICCIHVYAYIYIPIYLCTYVYIHVYIGSFIATLLLLSILAEGVFLYVNIYEHNLLWWLGIFSAIYASCRTLIPDNTKLHRNHEIIILELSVYTHYLPIHWIDNCHKWQVRHELAELFPWKIKVFILELCSVILTPIVLCFSLPKCAPSIIEFIRDHSKYIDNIGTVCDYSLFDFDVYGDVAFGAPAEGYVGAEKRPEGGKLGMYSVYSVYRCLYVLREYTAICYM